MIPSATESSVLIGRLCEVGVQSARDIAATVHRLITSGELPPGTRLPTVRRIATALGVSAATVSEAWRLLRRDGLLDSRRRNGMYVRERAVLEPVVSRSVVPQPVGLVVDLGVARPDLGLLPAVPPIEVDRRSAAFAVSPRLLRALGPEVPFPAQEWLVAEGLREGIRRALGAFAGPGDVVAVGVPLAPHLVEALRGGRVVQVGCDEDGPEPDSLRAVLRHRPKVFVLPTSVYLSCGQRCTERRVRELAGVLAEARAVGILEVDELGPLAPASPSLGPYLPGRVVLVRSYGGAFGPDLGMCVMGGSAALIGSIRDRSGLGSGPSPGVQDAVAHLIGDPMARSVVRHARENYVRRRDALGGALVRRGVAADYRGGFGVWVDVVDSVWAKAVLERHGVVVVADGSCYFGEGLGPEPGPGTHIGLVAGALPDEGEVVEVVADLVAASRWGER